MDKTTDTRALLETMSAKGGLRCRKPLPGALGSLPADTPARDRIEGMLLGLAIGDSLGNTSESDSPWRRAELHGEIRDYLPNHRFGGSRRGFPSDDTQLSYRTLESILEAGSLEPADVARRFAGQRIFGMGQAVREFVANMGAGLPWEECGPAKAGNGALMRVAPLVLPSLGAPGPEAADRLAADLIIGSMITHNDPASIASCLAFGAMLRSLLSMGKAPEPGWWMHRFVELARLVETEELYTVRGGRWQGWSGRLSDFVLMVLPPALEAGLSTLEACEAWHSGAYLLETVPSVLYILARHGGDPEEALVRAVNDTRDNDSVASIVGAAVGALHGAAALPPSWLSGLSGRLQYDDEGRVKALARRAALRFGGQAGGPPPEAAG